MRITIGHLSTFYHTATVLMARKDINKTLGADVVWELFGTGPAIVEAFGRGELDLAYLGLPPAIVGIDRGVPIKCIAGGHVEGTVLSGRDGLPSYPGTDSLSEILSSLAGKRVGVPGKGSIHDVILSDALDGAGLTGSVEVINFKWSDSIVEAMAKGEVSGAAGTPALAVALRRYAGGRVLFPPALLWPFNPSYGIVATERFIKEHSDTAGRFLTLHEEADELLRTCPQEAAGIIASVVGVVDAGFVAETLSVSPRYCAQLSRDYIDSTMKFVHAQRRLGYISKALAEDDIFDPSLIEKTHPPGDHY